MLGRWLCETFQFELEPIAYCSCIDGKIGLVSMKLQLDPVDAFIRGFKGLLVLWGQPLVLQMDSLSV